MDKRVLFRADSSSSIGLGHIKRDLVYASRLQTKDIAFATRELEGNINHLIPYPVHILKSTDIDELVRLCKALKIEKLIIDNYTLSYEDEKRIKELCDLELSVFDDTYEKHYCDEVINHNLGATAQGYRNRLPSFSRISLIAPLIRTEFLREKKRRREKEGLFLSLGGTDSNNLTLKVLKALKPKGMKVNLATTSSNPHLASLKAYANLNRWVRLHIDADVPRLLNSSTFAIVTPSVLASEALYMGTPLLSVLTASNQIEIEKFLRRERFTTLKASEVHKLKRTNLFQTRRNLKPYFRPKKSAKLFLQHTRKEDLMELFKLANDPAVRRNSFSSEAIALDVHTKWLDETLLDKNITLYTVRSEQDRLVAQLRFKLSGKKAIISISLAKGFRGRGLGAKIIKLALKSYLQEHPCRIIEAHIKEENISSQKSFEKAGFRRIKNEKKVLYYHFGEQNA